METWIGLGPKRSPERCEDHERQTYLVARAAAGRSRSSVGGQERAEARTPEQKFMNIFCNSQKPQSWAVLPTAAVTCWIQQCTCNSTFKLTCAEAQHHRLYLHICTAPSSCGDLLYSAVHVQFNIEAYLCRGGTASQVIFIYLYCTKLLQ